MIESDIPADTIQETEKFLHQLIFTNVESEKSPHGKGGFQTLCDSLGHQLSSRQRLEIEKRIGGQCPVERLVFFRLDDWFVLARIVPVHGTDSAGRTGLIFAHALLSSQSQLNHFLNNPFFLYQTVKEQGAFFESYSSLEKKYGVIQSTIPTLLLPTHMAKKEEANLLKEYPDSYRSLVIDVFSSITNPSKSIGIAMTFASAAAYSKSIQILPVLLGHLPPQLRLQFSFDTYFLGNVVQTPFTIIGVPKLRESEFKMLRRYFLTPDKLEAPKTQIVPSDSLFLSIISDWTNESFLENMDNLRDIADTCTVIENPIRYVHKVCAENRSIWKMVREGDEKVNRGNSFLNRVRNAILNTPNKEIDASQLDEFLSNLINDHPLQRDFYFDQPKEVLGAVLSLAGHLHFSRENSKPKNSSGILRELFEQSESLGQNDSYEKKYKSWYGMNFSRSIVKFEEYMNFATDAIKSNRKFIMGRVVQLLKNNLSNYVVVTTNLEMVVGIQFQLEHDAELNSLGRLFGLDDEPDDANKFTIDQIVQEKSTKSDIIEYLNIFRHLDPNSQAIASANLGDSPGHVINTKHSDHQKVVFEITSHMTYPPRPCIRIQTKKRRLFMGYSSWWNSDPEKLAALCEILDVKYLGPGAKPKKSAPKNRSLVFLLSRKQNEKKQQREDQRESKDRPLPLLNDFQEEMTRIFLDKWILMTQQGAKKP